MKIAVPNQRQENEARVALTPAVVKKLASEQVQVVVETGAGLESGANDQAYTDAGATIATGDQIDAMWQEADVVLTVRPPTADQVSKMKEGAKLVGVLFPLKNKDLVQAALDRKLTTFSMEFVPRISRAQAMDVLSSQANIGGYKAVVMSAEHAPKMFPMMMTAAGTIAPARVLVIGAGVAGLQAIATAKRLGAVVEAYDVRPAVKEQIQSLGARFVELPQEDQPGEAAGGYAKEQSEEQQKKQAELMAKHVIGADAVITTAAVFGKAPPMLIPGDVVEKMKSGAVLVDMAADPDAGRGNCEATRPGEKYTTEQGVTIIGTLNLPSLVAVHASQMYAANVNAFLKEILKEEQITLDLEDEIQKGAIITHEGEVKNKMVAEAIGSEAA